MDFRWRDGDRTIRFGRGAIAEAPDLLGDDYLLLTTPRGRDAAPAVVAGARAVHEVAPGRVDELAGDLLGAVEGATTFVALGGGRVVDVAKALADADPGRRRRVAAIPTTLSAAEMTRVHRKAAGAPQDTPGVRPQVVLNDPALSASQPPEQLAASTANALGHAIEGSLTSLTSPVPVLAARDAVRQLARAWRGGEPDRDVVALGALLSGYAIDAAWYGVHHVVAQTLVRGAGLAHGQANAAMLPHTTAFLRERASSAVLRLDEAADATLEDVAADLARRAEATRLRDLGVDEARLDDLAAATDGRPELTLIGAPVTRAEVHRLLQRAF